MSDNFQLNTKEFGWNGTDGYARNGGLYALLLEKPVFSFQYTSGVLSSDPNAHTAFIGTDGQEIVLTQAQHAEVLAFIESQAVEDPWLPDVPKEIEVEKLTVSNVNNKSLEIHVDPSDNVPHFHSDNPVDFDKIPKVEGVSVALESATVYSRVDKVVEEHGFVGLYATNFFGSNANSVVRYVDSPANKITHARANLYPYVQFDKETINDFKVEFHNERKHTARPLYVNVFDKDDVSIKQYVLQSGEGIVARYNATEHLYHIHKVVDVEYDNEVSPLEAAIFMGEQEVFIEELHIDGGL